MHRARNRPILHGKSHARADGGAPGARFAVPSGIARVCEEANVTTEEMRLIDRLRRTAKALFCRAIRGQKDERDVGQRGLNDRGIPMRWCCPRGRENRDGISCDAGCTERNKRRRALVENMVHVQQRLAKTGDEEGRRA